MGLNFCQADFKAPHQIQLKNHLSIAVAKSRTTEYECLAIYIVVYFIVTKNMTFCTLRQMFLRFRNDTFLTEQDTAKSSVSSFKKLIDWSCNWRLERLDPLCQGTPEGVQCWIDEVAIQEDVYCEPNLRGPVPGSKLTPLWVLDLTFTQNNSHGDSPKMVEMTEKNR